MILQHLSGVLLTSFETFYEQDYNMIKLELPFEEDLSDNEVKSQDAQAEVIWW